MSFQVAAGLATEHRYWLFRETTGPQDAATHSGV